MLAQRTLNCSGEAHCKVWVEEALGAFLGEGANQTKALL